MDIPGLYLHRFIVVIRLQLLNSVDDVTLSNVVDNLLTAKYYNRRHLIKGVSNYFEAS